MNKLRYIVLLSFITVWYHAHGQGNFAEAKFHEGSNLFINSNPQGALAAVNEGLKTDPGNEKLITLKKILEQEKKEQEKKQREQEQKEKQKQQQQKEQQEKDKEKKEEGEKKEEEKDKEAKEEKNKESKENKDKDSDKKDPKDPKQKEQENKEVPQDVLDRLKQMKISEEKARMILEAMKNQEIQYLQQNKRKATRPRDRNKPDW